MRVARIPVTVGFSPLRGNRLPDRASHHGAQDSGAGPLTASDRGTCPPKATTVTPDRVLAHDDPIRELLSRVAELPAGDPDRAALREEAIRRCVPMAEYLARRYRDRGEPLDDLVQVAIVGLIKAIDGFQPERGVPFSGYAIPTIIGELKRHFRDRGWSVRVPRRLQELGLEISRATGDLTQQLGRSPTVADIAAHLGVSEEDVLLGLDSGQAYHTLSLNSPQPGDESGTELGELLGDDDPDIELVEQREALRPLIARLPRREQRILTMRFFGNMTQSQIAAAVGLSQMHVSRLLSHALEALREGLMEG
jgi:RNA polymerase sigma-B factor